MYTRYHAAVELELWKRAEEEAFRVQLGQKEETLMRALAEEWRLRDTQREALTKRKIEECVECGFFEPPHSYQRK